MRSALLLCSVAAVGLAQEARQATGVKVGEVTPDSAIIWVRHTQAAERNWKGIAAKGKGGMNVPLTAKGSANDLEGAAPGAPGRVRVRAGLRQDLADALSTPWVDVTAATDFSHQFRLAGLKPHTQYHYATETAAPGGKPVHGALRGSFRTAPLPHEQAEVTFTVVTGMMYADMDHRDGFHIYESMLKVNPQFIVPTGDSVYYDNENPRATSVALARYHWDRMYSLPRHIAFHLRVPGYWEKDDHDTLENDCWPTMDSPLMKPLTFDEGRRLFLQQVPMSERTYRTFRWGKGLQVWLVEGRDFRSPNDRPDGPGKTIWGAEQKRWLKESLLASDADWRVLVSPTPLVGPDRGNKGDNHANKAFTHEGNEIRKWIQENVSGNFFVACGDRHWQYHSVHPETKVNEFSCGPASDEHAGGSPGEDRTYHRFHRVQGGFLSVTVTRTGDIVFRHHDVKGAVVYEYKQARRPGA